MVEKGDTWVRHFIVWNITSLLWWKVVRWVSKLANVTNAIASTTIASATHATLECDKMWHLNVSIVTLKCDTLKCDNLVCNRYPPKYEVRRRIDGRSTWQKIKWRLWKRIDHRKLQANIIQYTYMCVYHPEVGIPMFGVDWLKPWPLTSTLWIHDGTD